MTRTSGRGMVKPSAGIAAAFLLPHRSTSIYLLFLSSFFCRLQSESPWHRIRPSNHWSSPPRPPASGRGGVGAASSHRHGKPVKIRYGPAAVSGDEPSWSSHWDAPKQDRGDWGRGDAEDIPGRQEAVGRSASQKTGSMATSRLPSVARGGDDSPMARHGHYPAAAPLADARRSARAGVPPTKTPQHFRNPATPRTQAPPLNPLHQGNPDEPS